MKFTKMHGCGNDYVYVNGFTEKVADKPKAVVALSDRHFGIGSDGVIFINPSQQADFEMVNHLVQHIVLSVLRHQLQHVDVLTVVINAMGLQHLCIKVYLLKIYLNQNVMILVGEATTMIIYS